MIIGLTGPNASGKGEAAKVLQSLGFKYYSLSDEIREYCKTTKLEPTRDNMIEIGQKFRKEHGPGVWATKLIARINYKQNLVIDSIRHPEEVKILKTLTGFKLIGLDCPLEIRFKRALARARTGYSLTLKDFHAKEQREMTKDKNSQQLGETMKLANKVIVNDTSLEELDSKIKSLVQP